MRPSLERCSDNRHLRRGNGSDYRRGHLRQLQQTDRHPCTGKRNRLHRGNVSENWKTWATYIKAGQAQGQTQTDGEDTVPADGTLTGDGTIEADKVTLQGDATLENVKTKATEIADNTISVITLTGTGNALGAITVGSGGNPTLTANEGQCVTVTSVANSGTFTDNTGSVTAVTGDASSTSPPLVPCRPTRQPQAR